MGLLTFQLFLRTALQLRKCCVIDHYTGLLEACSSMLYRFTSTAPLYTGKGMIFFLQLSLIKLLSLTNAPMVTFVLLEGLVILREMFRYVSIELGDTSVITVGPVMTPEWSVNNLVTPHQITMVWYHIVRFHTDFFINLIFILTYIHVCIADVTRKYDSFFGFGNGIVFLDNLYCSSSSSKLTDCNHGAIRCNPFTDIAGVICSGK